MRRNLNLIFVLLTFALLLGAMAHAQSGRKQKKADPQPPVQGVNRPELRTQPEPEVEVEKPKEKEKGPGLMIATGMGDIDVPLYYTDIAREACLRELRDELKTADLREARNQSRGEAMKTAKDDDRTYVVWMEVLYDRFGSVNSTGVDLRYTVFEPKTGKIAASGSGYPTQPTRGVPIPPIGASRAQVYLDWMGRDVAQQVIRRLGLRP
jgi:hypothetical protein